LYEGGHNLETLNIKYTHECNSQTISKLSNQVDFLNKENQRVYTQVDFLRGDKAVMDEMGALKKEIKDLTFENSTVRRDL
jgi:hypothetical protein